MDKREIKFRAWDKNKKEWIGENGTTFTSEKPTEGVVALILDGHLRVFSAEAMADMVSVNHSEYESKNPVKQNYERQYILSQFTGLKDKNGKDIYEGDIIRNGKVVWDNFNSRFILIGKDWEQEMKYNKDQEVIGNIYENSELLK